MAAVFDAHLRRAQHVAGRVQADAHAVQHHRFAIFKPLQRDVAQPCAQHAGADGGGQVGTMAAARVVGMGVGDDGALHRPPGVDVEAPGSAVQPFGPQHDEVVCGGHGFSRRLARRAAWAAWAA